MTASGWLLRGAAAPRRRDAAVLGGLALPLCRSLFEPGCAVEALAAAALSE